MTVGAGANVNVRAYGAVTLDGLSGGSVFRVDTLGASVDIQDVTITGGSGHNAGGDLYGGAIFANAAGASPTTVTLTNVVLNNNDADRGGAVALLNASTLSGTNVTMTNNAATRGGAFYATNTASATIAGLVANANSAGSLAPAVSGDGGAVYLTGTSTLTLTNPQIYANETFGGDGGGIFLGGGTLNCTGTAGSATLYGIYRNVAAGEGGGVYLSSGALNNTSCDYGVNGLTDDNSDGDGDSQDDIDGASLSNGDDLENDVSTDF
jgi:predicted outer membrane repeat protein